MIQNSSLWWDLQFPQKIETYKFKCRGNNIEDIGGILPVCKICLQKTVWAPEFKGNIDVGYSLMYHCSNHKDSTVIIDEEKDSLRLD